MAASHWISPLLFETSIADITVMGLVATLLGSTTLVACRLPARLATQGDPVEYLRSEA